MLIEFRVENHRSLGDEQVLTMEAGRVGDAEDPRPREVDGHGSRVLPVAALYGANASGKSNLLGAFVFMQRAVLYSHRLWSPAEGVPREPFAWGRRCSQPSTFEATLLIRGVRYTYGFVADDERFVEEWLFAWPQGRKQTWFERDGETFKFGDNLRGENRMMQGVTRPNALFLSVAAQHDHAQLQPLFLWFSAIEGLGPAEGADRMSERRAALWLARGRRSPQPLLFTEQAPVTEDRQGALRDLLRAADVGILDLRVGESDPRQPARSSRQTVWLRHQSEVEDAWLPLEEESQGTRTLFHFGPTLLTTLATGGMMVVDELEKSLHPLVAREIIRRFNDPTTNPRNAQLLFATHDTNLIGTAMGEPVLRRDQVWLAEKDREGTTVIYPLTDFKPRKSENLERGYLQGRYGAIPFLGDLTVVQD